MATATKSGLRPGVYLANKEHRLLFRFECFLDDGVVLEDARLGDLVSMSLRDFAELKLSRVDRLKKGVK